MKRILLAALVTILCQASLATTSDEVKQKTSDAVEAAADYSKEQKEAFQKDMEVKIDVVKTEIADLKKKAATKTGEAKKEAQTQIANLEKKQSELKADLAKLKKSSGKAWAEVKVGMGKAWDSLADSYKKAKAEFSEDK